MKHTRTILASSILAALMGVSGTAFAQGEESLHANATAASRVAMATGPEAIPASSQPAYASYEQPTTALARVEAETGPAWSVAYPSEPAVAVASTGSANNTLNSETAASTEPAEPQLAMAESAENAVMEQYAVAESRYDASAEPTVALAMTDAPASLPLDEEESGLAETAMVDSRANATALASDAVTPADPSAETADPAAQPAIETATDTAAQPAAESATEPPAAAEPATNVTSEASTLPVNDDSETAFVPPLRSDAAAPTPTATPVTGNYDAPPSTPTDDVNADEAPTTRSEYE